MAKLGHPDGEINLTKGAGNTGIIQCVSRLLHDRVLY
jgi:L-lactate dehydrogenase (cytochrome)